MEVDERTNDLQLVSEELEVLELSATGMTTPEVATWLGLTRDEVRDHLARAIVAVGARSKLEAVVTALRLGLIHPDRRDGHGIVDDVALTDGRLGWRSAQLPEDEAPDIGPLVQDLVARLSGAVSRFGLDS